MSVALKKSLNVTVALATVWGAMPTQAFAGCAAGGSSGGSGPPSISATEVSTAQALQYLRKRQDETISGGGVQVASNAPPAPPEQAPPPPPPTTKPATAAGTSAGSSAASNSSSSAAATATQPVVKPKADSKVPYAAKPKPVVVAEKPAASGDYERNSYTLKSTPADVVAPDPTRGVWGSAYADYEDHTGWTAAGGQRGALSSRSRTVGVLSGTDWVVRNGASKVLFGVLGGVSTTKTDYSSGFIVTPSVQPGQPNFDNFSRTDAKDSITGGGGGIYALLVSGKFTADAMFKVDGYNLEQQDNIQQFGYYTTPGGSLTNCGGPGPVTGRNGSVDYATFTLASNLSYRYPLNSDSWFEPTFGMRYTHASYGTQSGTLPLGYVDGDALRLQGGARLGNARPTEDGGVWLTTLTGLLYSDVVVTGFSQSAGLGFNPATIDEGKLRVMGQLTTSLVKANGVTYLATGEVRGGDQVFGVGGKLGVRYEW